MTLKINKISFKVGNEETLVCNEDIIVLLFLINRVMPLVINFSLDIT